MTDLLRYASRPAIVVVLIVVAMVFLHYATAPEPTVDLGPFKRIEYIMRGTNV